MTTIEILENLITDVWQAVAEECEEWDILPDNGVDEFTGRFASNGVTTDAEAMRTLAALGLLAITSDDGDSEVKATATDLEITDAAALLYNQIKKETSK